MPLKYNPYTGELDLVSGSGGGGGGITQLNTDSGNVTPNGAGVVEVFGGNSLSTSGAGNTVTLDLDAPVSVPNGGTGLTSVTDGAFLIGDGTNALEIIGPLTDGQLLIGNTAGVSPTASTLTAGAGISIVNGSGTITIASSSTAMMWIEVVGTSQALAVNTGYIANNAALVTLTLPATASLGDIVRVVGKGAGLFRIAQNSGQTIHYISSDTTTGVGGSLTALEQYAAIELVCTTANDDWTVLSSTGNYTVI